MYSKIRTLSCEPEPTKWKEFVFGFENLDQEISLAVGKYVELKDAYKSISENNTLG